MSYTKLMEYIAKLWEFLTVQKKVRALNQAIDRLLDEEKEHKAQANVWLAEALDVLHLALPDNSRILKELTNKENDTEHVYELLKAASSTFSLHSNKNNSLLDEFALIGVSGDNEKSSYNKFEMKHALYTSFANSLPLRTMLILLFITLGVAGWKVYDLASIGAHAKETTDNAIIKVEKARKELGEAQSNLEKLIKQAEQDSNKAKVAFKKSDTELRKNQKLAIAQLETQSIKYNNDLANIKKLALTEMKAELRSKKSNFTRELATINEQNKRSLKHQLNNIKSDLESFQKNERIRIEAILLKHQGTQKKRLSERTALLSKTLEEWQGAGESQVKAVVARVEAQEKQWMLNNKKQFEELNKRIIKLDENITTIESNYNEHLPLARTIADITEQVKNKTSKINPAWIAAVLEVRTALIIVLTIITVLATFIAWRTRT
ncbi:hypothetical protein MNBD_GAMMA25-365 [hydrothermal vent metagenome]|uniref:Uncharacterized protein n=1 Tax=hydrothermal vent metagenome TaxID=652676 RepID=A0A3B1BMJ1_9ZZZZ